MDFVSSTFFVPKVCTVSVALLAIGTRLRWRRSRSPFERLPVELKLAVIEQIATVDELLVLRTVSKAWRAAVESGFSEWLLTQAFSIRLTAFGEGHRASKEGHRASVFVKNHLRSM
jgi:uncharacterized paraquat-inducible protein A